MGIVGYLYPKVSVREVSKTRREIDERQAKANYLVKTNRANSVLISGKAFSDLLPAIISRFHIHRVDYVITKLATSYGSGIMAVLLAPPIQVKMHPSAEVTGVIREHQRVMEMRFFGLAGGDVKSYMPPIMSPFKRGDAKVVVAQIAPLIAATGQRKEDCKVER